LPDTLWLLENAPSPPIIQIINEYLPSLPIKATIDNKIPMPSKTITESLKKGVAMRNKLIHSGRASIDHSKIGHILFAVEDLLWLLDFYRTMLGLLIIFALRLKKKCLHD
jgi:hypothetical protein